MGQGESAPSVGSGKDGDRVRVPVPVRVEQRAGDVDFVARDFHPKSGMKCLIESFYRSITDGAPLPIPYSEVMRTARIMDLIFEHFAGAPEDRGGAGLPDPDPHTGNLRVVEALQNRARHE